MRLSVELISDLSCVTILFKHDFFNKLYFFFVLDRTDGCIDHIIHIINQHCVADIIDFRLAGDLLLPPDGI